LNILRASMGVLIENAPLLRPTPHSREIGRPSPARKLAPSLRSTVRPPGRRGVLVGGNMLAPSQWGGRPLVEAPERDRGRQETTGAHDEQTSAEVPQTVCGRTGALLSAAR